MKTIGKALGALLLVLVAVLAVRAMLASSSATDVARVVVAVDEGAIARRLSEAIQIQTVSPGPPAVQDPEPFGQYISWLEGAYPAVHGALRRDVLGDLSVLFTWPGTDPEAAPVLLTAHYDVVPVLPASEADWEHPPFAGEIADGYVWGRGALDDKGAMIAILDAATLLLDDGFQPTQTVYLAFGHDEEIGGQNGAGAITEHLRSQGVQLAWSLDEGSFVIEGVYPGVDVPVASINVAEKGYLTIDLVAKGVGGHSSMPPPETAVGVLAAAIVRLQENPMPGGIDGVTAESLDALAGYMPFLPRLVFANRWLFGGLLESQLAAGGASNAVLRTTIAPTMLEGSVKENVLPIEAVGTVNFRLHPRDTKEDVIAHVERVVDDERVEIRVRRDGNPSSEVSSATSAGFRAIARAMGQVFGPVAVVPGLTVGGTDSRHYGQIADDAYRFNPMVVTQADTAGFHGTNERISIENLAQDTRADAQILRNAGVRQP